MINLLKKATYSEFGGIKKIHSKIFNTIKYYICNEEMTFAVWWNKDGGTNWGDALNPILIEQLTKKKVIHYEDIFHINNIKVYSVIGSILGIYNTKNIVVWGSGYISSTSKIKKIIDVRAVRGPLTRNLLISQGINCPEVYGDPALLYPLFYKPTKTTEYKLGIIPHFVDKDNVALNHLEENPNIIIIDVMDDINSFVDKICSCEMVASSSLHGLIAADAYGIPSIWIEFSDKIRGNRFKYKDYFLSVGRSEENPIRVDNKITVDEIIKSNKEYTINVDLVKLLKSCPFLKTENMEVFIADLENMILNGYIKNEGIKF